MATSNEAFGSSTTGLLQTLTNRLRPKSQLAGLVHHNIKAMMSVGEVTWAPHYPIGVKELVLLLGKNKVFGPHIAQIYALRSVQKHYLTSLKRYLFDPSALNVRLGL
jgi:hypothetical protein